MLEGHIEFTFLLLRRLGLVTLIRVSSGMFGCSRIIAGGSWMFKAARIRATAENQVSLRSPVSPFIEWVQRFRKLSPFPHNNIR